MKRWPPFSIPGIRKESEHKCSEIKGFYRVLINSVGKQRPKQARRSTWRHIRKVQNSTLDNKIETGLPHGHQDRYLLGMLWIITEWNGLQDGSHNEWRPCICYSQISLLNRFYCFRKGKPRGTGGHKATGPLDRRSASASMSHSPMSCPWKGRPGCRRSRAVG